MNDVAEAEPVKTPKTRYDSLTLQVSTLNDQIVELQSTNDAIESDIDTWEQGIKNARRIIAKNERQMEKLRAKRDAVQDAAFRVSKLDQP